jgi:hypothetical protein
MDQAGLDAIRVREALTVAESKALEVLERRIGFQGNVIRLVQGLDLSGAAEAERIQSIFDKANATPGFFGEDIDVAPVG